MLGFRGQLSSSATQLSLPTHSLASLQVIQLQQ